MNDKATAKVVVGLGSNLSDQTRGPADLVKAAIACIADRKDVTHLTTSRFYQSPAWPVEVPPKPDYINAAILVKTSLSLRLLMDHLLEIEQDFGRRRSALWDSRTLDLDILAADAAPYPDQDAWQSARKDWLESGRKEPVGSLFVPHLRLTDRSFALKPLLDVAPDWCDPLTGAPFASYTSSISQTDWNSLKPVSTS